ncbi:PrgI family protein [Ruminococcus sp.]|uniref:PrgI family protein n=1 Tax=Ruminococcus sp. TaxID=41978 RepID=UPI002588A5AC|nr:PrgI family protein [Ruminococcus sp.]MCR5019984.1 PrgI family protein [Ruminococcus sp.]
MIEIRIPKEIKNYREKLFFGLTLRQCICTAIALLICVPIYIFGNRFLPQEAVSWVVILIAVPLMFTGFFRYNDMAFEQFALEIIRFYTSPQQRIYSYEPPFMELRNGYMTEELTTETEEKKSRKKRLFRKK